MITILGVDPGATGGICAIRSGRIHTMFVMPESLAVLRQLLGVFDPASTHTFLEKAQSFPKQGIASAFNYGTHYGELRGTFSAMHLRITLVPPGVWAKSMHSGASGDFAKAKSLEVARRLFPGETFIPPNTRGKKPHMGLVDATLIALYGWQKMVKTYEGSDAVLSDM